MRKKFLVFFYSPCNDHSRESGENVNQVENVNRMTFTEDNDNNDDDFTSFIELCDNIMSV